MNRRSASDQSLYSSGSTNRTGYTKSSHRYDRWSFVFFVFGATNILNALWMLIAPEHWYYNLPANVPGTGPFNVHFVRDIGCIFLLCGIGIIVGGFFLPEYRLPLFTMNTLFYMLHMFVHIHEVVSGRLEMKQFWFDLPLVYIPSVITFGLNIILIRKHMASSKPKSSQMRGKN